MNLTMESVVVDADGKVIGRLVGVNIESATNRIVDLLVRPEGAAGGLLELPVSAVAGSGLDEVTLLITVERPRAFPAGHVQAVSPPDTSRSVVDRQVEREALDFGAVVVCLDGPVGALWRVLYDQYSYEIEELVIGASHPRRLGAPALLDHEVAVPAAWVRRLERNRVELSSRRREIRQLPLAPEDR